MAQLENGKQELPIKKEVQVMPEKTNDSDAFESGAKMQLKPIGASGTEIFAGYFSEEYLQALRGRVGAKVFDEIRRSESQVAMLLNAVMNPIKSGTWEFEAAKDVAGSDKHVELIEYCAKEMIDWEAHLHEALTMLIFGYSIFEVVHNVVFNHPKYGTFNGLKGIAFRSQKTIERWNVSKDTGELESVDQWVQGDLAKNHGTFLKMQAEFLLVFTMNKEGDNFEGISALRPMYGAWFRKNLYLRLAGIGLEKSAIGTPIGKIPANQKDQAQIEAFKEVLSNFAAHESAYLLVPAGWDIEIIKNEFDASKVKEMILLENSEMINSLVANFLALGMNGGSGSFALGTDLSDFFLGGLQTYANIVAGIWNRKLIPNLVKLNFGQQPCYPKLKVTGINDKAGKELAEIIQILSNSKSVKPDMKLEEFLRKQYKLPTADPASAREDAPAQIDPKTGLPLPPKMGPDGKPLPPEDDKSAKKPTDEEPVLEKPEEKEDLELSENRLQLAESYKKQWAGNKDKVKETMQAGLAELLVDLKKQVARGYKGASASGKVSLGLSLEPKTSPYIKSLREVLAEIANQALVGARKETPKAKKVKLSERIQLAAPRGGYYEALPANIRRLVQAQSALIANTQAADINKVVAFQYTSSQTSTEDLDQILLDIEAAAQPMIEGSTARGMSVDAAAGNAVSAITNQARIEWFFEPEVLETIESFTFYNEDPISEICQELDGTTWAVNDPDLDRYSPPLHHNCKSRLIPNEKGADNNPEIARNGTPVTQKGLDSITLCECHYGLDFRPRG